jgi:ankyrin repeat protein
MKLKQKVKAIMNFVEEDNAEEMFKLINKEVLHSFSEKSKFHMPLICYVAWKGSFNCLKKLLENGFDPNEKRAYGDGTPLIETYSIPCAELLLDYGADIKAKLEHGLTRLNLAFFRQELDMAEFLIQRGDTISEYDIDQILVYHRPPVEFIKLIFENGMKWDKGYAGWINSRRDKKNNERIYDTILEYAKNLSDEDIKEIKAARLSQLFASSR